MSLLKDVGLWDILAGLSLSRSKPAGQPIPMGVPLPYPSSVASSVPTGIFGPFFGCPEPDNRVIRQTMKHAAYELPMTVMSMPWPCH